MTVTSAWVLNTARLRMTPVGYWDLADLVRLKADPLAYALMLGGVRSPLETAEELAEDIQAWGRDGYGIWAVRAPRGKFLGITGLMHRADGRGVALRFAFSPGARGYGLASEAASATLLYAHDAAGLARVVAVAREDNFSSRAILGAIGMAEDGRFWRDGLEMVTYASERPSRTVVGR
jgi:RimJ/RimL family protein N-acetyltransferase